MDKQVRGDIKDKVDTNEHVHTYSNHVKVCLVTIC